MAKEVMTESDPLVSCNRWTFTLENATEKEITSISDSLTGDVCVGGIVSEKTDAGKRILIGFVHFKKRQSVKKLKQWINQRAKFTPAIGTDRLNVDRCVKCRVIHLIGQSESSNLNLDESELLNYAVICAQQRIRNVPKSYLLNHRQLSQAYLKYYINIEDIAKHCSPCTQLKSLRFLQKQYQQVQWKLWQLHLLKMLEVTPDNRSVIWMYSNEGNTGKTFLAHYLYSHSVCFLSDTTKFSEVSEIFVKNTNQRIVIFDLCRDEAQKVEFRTLHNIKDGCMRGPEFHPYFFTSPWLLVFANAPPDMSKMSMDRWRIKEINLGEDMVTAGEYTPSYVQPMEDDGSEDDDN